MARSRKKKAMKTVRRLYRLALKWVVTRGAEPTTWLGAGAIAGMLGYNSPEWAALAYKAAGICAAIAMVMGEKGSKPNPGRKIKTD